MSHNKLAAQIVRQVKIGNDNNFAIVFGSMGVNHDVADFFLNEFKATGVLQRVVMFQNLSNDPIAERIMVPRLALTAVSYTHLIEEIKKKEFDYADKIIGEFKDKEAAKLKKALDEAEYNHKKQIDTPVSYTHLSVGKMQKLPTTVGK